MGSALQGVPDEELFLLRFAMEHPVDVHAAVRHLREVMQWRQGNGKAIVESAAGAVRDATKDGKWHNPPVMAAAPHTAQIGKYIGASQILPIGLPGVGELCTVIRTSAIDDTALMNDISEDQLVDFFLYAREVLFIVTQQRSRARGELLMLPTANDFTGVRKFLDSRFQAALMKTTRDVDRLYPSSAGPTVILNAPMVVRALGHVLAPLFPIARGMQLKFASVSVDGVEDLADLLTKPVRGRFVRDLEAAVVG